MLLDKCFIIAVWQLYGNFQIRLKACLHALQIVCKALYISYIIYLDLYIRTRRQTVLHTDVEC